MATWRHEQPPSNRASERWWLAIDGIFAAHESVTNILSEKLRDLLEDRYMDAFNAATREAIEHDRALRWYIDQGLWSFGVSTPYEFIDSVLLYTLEDIANCITWPGTHVPGRR